jgi:hypothetical protein
MSSAPSIVRRHRVVLSADATEAVGNDDVGLIRRAQSGDADPYACLVRPFALTRPTSWNEDPSAGVDRHTSFLEKGVRCISD